MKVASDVDGLRLVFERALRREYRIAVSDDASVVGLWRLTTT
jgi:hypothetical protein